MIIDLELDDDDKLKWINFIENNWIKICNHQNKFLYGLKVFVSNSTETTHVHISDDENGFVVSWNIFSRNSKFPAMKIQTTSREFADWVLTVFSINQ